MRATALLPSTTCSPGIFLLHSTLCAARCCLAAPVLLLSTVSATSVAVQRSSPVYVSRISQQPPTVCNAVLDTLQDLHRWVYQGPQTIARIMAGCSHHLDALHWLDAYTYHALDWQLLQQNMPTAFYSNLVHCLPAGQASTVERFL